MRISHVYVSAMLLAACSHASPGPAPHTQANATETRDNLGELQQSPTVAEARHEPVTPDPGIAAAAPAVAPQAPTPLAPPAAPLAPTPAPLVSTTAAPPPAAAGSKGDSVDAPKPTREESALRERIQVRLSQERRLSYTAQHVRLEVKQGDVTVQGEVRTAREKQEVAQIIESITGVRRVNNQLAVINQTVPAAANGPATR